MVDEVRDERRWKMRLVRGGGRETVKSRGLCLWLRYEERENLTSQAAGRNLCQTMRAG